MGKDPVYKLHIEHIDYIVGTTEWVGVNTTRTTVSTNIRLNYNISAIKEEKNRHVITLPYTY